MSDRPDIEAMEARERKTTPGPWITRKGAWAVVSAEPVKIDGKLIAPQIAIMSREHEDRNLPPYMRQEAFNADFTAHARIDIPALIAYIRHLEGEKCP